MGGACAFRQCTRGRAGGENEDTRSTGGRKHAYRRSALMLYCSTLAPCCPSPLRKPLLPLTSPPMPWHVLPAAAAAAWTTPTLSTSARWWWGPRWMR